MLLLSQQTVYTLMLRVSMMLANNAHVSYANDAKQRLQSIPQINHDVHGSACGVHAFASVDDVFGKNTRTPVLMDVFGTTHVTCSIHGVVRGDIGHITPRALGGVLYHESFVNGMWRITRYTPNAHIPHRIANAHLQCSMCNRLLGTHMNEQMIQWYNSIPAIVPL